MPFPADPGPDALQVARAMALLWAPAGQARVVDVLGAAGWKTSGGARFDRTRVKQAITALREHGWMRPWDERLGAPHELTDEARILMYREILEVHSKSKLLAALCEAFKVEADALRDPWRWPLDDWQATVAVVRLELLGGASDEDIARMLTPINQYLSWDHICQRACLEAFAPDLFMRIAPDFRRHILLDVLRGATTSFDVTRLELFTWTVAACEEDPFEFSQAVCERVAEILLLQGKRVQAVHLASLLEVEDYTRDEEDDDYLDVKEGLGEAIRAGIHAQDGEWAKAQKSFELALKQKRAFYETRTRVMDPSLSWLYVLSLLAQNTPKHLEKARKFAVAESGTRKPTYILGWHLWVRAVDIRMGREQADPDAFHRGAVSGATGLDGLWSCVLRVWLGRQTFAGLAAADMGPSTEDLVGRLAALGFTWLAELVQTCEEVYNGAAPPPGFFARGEDEHWRTVLGALRAVSGDGSGPSAKKTGKMRLIWSITLDDWDQIEAITPMEQTRGKRGWLKPKKIPLSRLVRATGLEPEDAGVARALRKEPGYTSRYRMDIAAAAVELIGHPRVFLAEDPSRLVEVVRGAASLDVVRRDWGFELIMEPEPDSEDLEYEYDYYNKTTQEERKEQEALRFLAVQRESDSRIRIVEFTPAQRRVAKLLEGALSVPHDQEEELQTTLQALSKHFQIQSDHVVPAQQVDTESRLRAELSPMGDGLMFRLVAAPLGPEGPRLTPGLGRTRLMATVEDQQLGTERDLAAERRHVDEVTRAVGFLPPPAADDPVLEWTVEDPELALALLELLPPISGISALDWPRGKPVHVIPVGHAQVTARITTKKDWFQLDGEIAVSEGLVLTFAALLEAGGGKSRFIPMGDGVYAALSRELHERAVELVSIAEARGDGAAVPQAAAAWLEELLQGTDAKWDRAFAARVKRLREAREWVPAVPATLLTPLRPYQEDGFVWAMRLAKAGFGACLADDMGLGKTIQALGVMLSRAADGPALVVAPTSVCGNWLAEMRRFSPSLEPIDFSTSDRNKCVEDAGPGDVVVLSYTMMLQEKDLLGTRSWTTLVADEAQAVKNPAAKRSKALFGLEAGFRMALSGTPIENRLSELWSIMKFCNPGLLATARVFSKRFGVPIERDQDREAQRRLKRLIAPFVLRRTKAEVLHDLPPRTELMLSVSADPAEAAHYEAIRREAVAEAERVAAGGEAGGGRFHILSLLMKLRRAACDPRLVTPTYPDRGAKVQAFGELAAELVANGHKALVFSQFVDFLKLLAEPLKEAGIRYEYLDGSTPSAERTRRVAAFQGGSAELFLISLKAGGFGLNLTAADYVVITDPWWNPAAEDQAMGRAHRIGQARPVTAYRLVREATLEERIIEMHHEKRALAEGILSEADSGASIPDPAELIALMRGD